MISGTFILVFLVLLVAVGMSIGFGLGAAVGFRRGVRETVALNDASYKNRLAADTEALKQRGENETAEVKSRISHQLQELQRLNMGMSAAPEVKDDQAKVISFPVVDFSSKPVA